MRSESERDWDARRYLRFEDERTRPARDLLAAVPLAQASRVVDLGCGPGNSTELLGARFPQAQLLGIDSSPGMIAQARRRMRGTTFEVADVSDWLPAPDTNLVFANALFQWIPNHLDALVRIKDALGAGSVLAIQVPDNFAEPTHRLMAEVGRDPRFAPQLAAADTARSPIPSLEEYYDRLSGKTGRVEVWRTMYQHALESPAAIVSLVETTGLRPYLGPLDAEQRAEFLAAYEARIAEAYPVRPDGKVLLRFPRVFVVCVR